VATIKRFEDLECWKEARNLVKLVYDMTKKSAFKKDFDLVRQVRRSAVSSMANMAEGFHRNSNKDFMRFLDYSRG
jgi:four helix bundle protein